MKKRKENQGLFELGMLKTLAEIDGNAAKGIYLVIYFFGTATFQDLLNAGYGESTIYDAVKKLQSGEFISKVGRGVYRLLR